MAQRDTITAETQEHPHSRFVGSPAFLSVVLVLLVGLAITRICLTYPVFTHTYDEPYHLAGGMEWLDKGAYTYSSENPPLARVAVALGPYLRGLRSHSVPGATYEGNAILFSSGNYFENLSLARLGTVPFLILGCAIVYMWGWRWFGLTAALSAVMLFTCLPPILGHSGVATVDSACMAAIAATLYTFMRWIEKPHWKQATWLGVTLALAVLVKFSSFLFLPPCFAIAIISLVLTNRAVLFNRHHMTARVMQVGLAAFVAFFLVWAGYRFNVQALSPTNGYHPNVDRHITNPLLRQVAYTALELPLPLLEIKNGLAVVLAHNTRGHSSYLLGEYRKDGWWYFFPIVLAVKTPIGFLLLAIAGLGVALFTRTVHCGWQRRLTALFAITIFIVCLPSHLNLGVRHLLPIYPLLSVLAGYGVSTLVRHRRRTYAVAGYVLAAWVGVESIVAHPDYLAYFNQFAAGHPERVLAESDLDWGQDLHRLVARLESLGVQEIGLAYFGTVPLDLVGLPSYYGLSPSVPSARYVAISVRYLTLENARDGAFDWLKRYEPIEKIGKSIYLFHIEEN